MSKGCWNYRIRKMKYTELDGSTIDGYDIVEAHYKSRKKSRKNKQYTWTVDSMCPWAEDAQGLKIILKQMLDALDKPIIEDNRVVDERTEEMKKKHNKI